jgi:hypothetical protein
MLAQHLACTWPWPLPNNVFAKEYQDKRLELGPMPL